jgi:hypothetical protein
MGTRPAFTVFGIYVSWVSRMKSVKSNKRVRSGGDHPRLVDLMAQ